MKARFVVLCSLIALGLPIASASARIDAPPADVLVQQIDTIRAQTNELRREAGQRPLRARFPYRAVTDPAYRTWVRAVWREHLSAARAEVDVPVVWRRLAHCETGGNWKHRNSMYQGGLGFYYGSWDAYRPKGFPAEAYLATPADQVAVGKRIRADVGWGAWPACSIRLGLR